MTLKFDRTILDLIAGGFLGEILAWTCRSRRGVYRLGQPAALAAGQGLERVQHFEYGDMV